MKNRAFRSAKETIATTYFKHTGVTTRTVTRPIDYADTLNVFVDQLHGDFKTVNPHMFRKTIHRDYEGSLSRDDPNEHFEQTGNLMAFTHQQGSVLDPSYLRNQAIANLYDKYRSGGVGSGLDLAVDIAEAHQVKRMLGETLKFVRFVRGFHPRQWANRWLEYQYGWKPLVSSVYGTVDALMHRRTYQYQRVIGKSKDEYYQTKSFKDAPLSGALEISSAWTRVRAMLVADFKFVSGIQAQLGGYTSLNPISVAWELVPYSFCVDWILDIGTYLRGMESALAYGAKGFVQGYEVYGYLVECTGTLSVYKNKPLSNQTITCEGTAFERISYKQRKAMGVYPIPTLPSFNANLGWQRLVSAASLLSQHVEGYTLWGRRGERFPESSVRKAWFDGHHHRP